jgi:hypothetical protein
VQSIRDRYLWERSVMVHLQSTPIAVSTARKSCKSLHSWRCGRCGRYFATLIEYIALFFRGLLPDRGPSKAALNAFVAEERTLEDLGDLSGSTSLQSGF